MAGLFFMSVTYDATQMSSMSRLITLVDLRGLEPLTPCMPCRCATSCAKDPQEVGRMLTRQPF